MILHKQTHQTLSIQAEILISSTPSDLRHHLLSCSLLVLHTFLSSMHSSRCSPDATHHWPFILHTKKSMFIPTAWAHTPTRLQREAEMREGIKKPLFSTLLWLWSVLNKGSDMESLLGTNSGGYTRCSYMNLWVHPNEGALGLNSARPGLKHPCVPTMSVIINLRIKHSWPFMFHLPWIKTWEQARNKKVDKRRDRERQTDRGLSEGKEQVSSCTSPHLPIQYMLFWCFNRWELPHAVHSIDNGSCSSIWTQPITTTGKKKTPVNFIKITQKQDQDYLHL